MTKYVWSYAEHDVVLWEDDEWECPECGTDNAGSSVCDGCGFDGEE